MPALTNKTALITGASRGIGRATATALAAEGAQIIIHYASSAAAAESLAAEIRSAGGKDFTLGLQALKRIGQPDDIAFLASGKARSITGATIPVDGGSKF